MKFLRNLIIILVVISVGWYLKNTLLKEDVDTPVRGLSANADKEQITEQVKSFSISGFSDLGKKTWEMEGKSANIFSDVIDLTDINADSYGDQVKVNLKADAGVFDRATNSVELRKNVIIVTDEGTRLTTEVLNWDATKELVHTDEHVFIQRKDMDITGTGASAKPDLKIAQIDKDVSVDVKDPPALITCDGPLEVDYDKSVAYFNNNVKLIDKDTTINTDKATAYFDSKEKVLKKILCEGNVTITRGRDSTYAEILTYLPGEGRVLLEGRPKIIIRDTEELMQRSKEKKNEQVKDSKSG